MENVEEKKRIEFDITQMIIETYNKIANWNNNDAYETPKQKSLALKIVAASIVEENIAKCVEGLGLKNGVNVDRGGVLVHPLEGEASGLQGKTAIRGDDVFNKLFMKK